MVAFVLAIGYWWPLPEGGGFIGGDTYNYFFPLKDFYSQGLHHHELRLWHPGIGNGVPVLGESQTGVFYPFYLIPYALLDLNTAYSSVFLGHYVLAYLFTYALGKVLGLRVLASHLMAITFVYGWFPPRACLEWAIVTGTWLPAVLAASIRFRQTGHRRWFWGSAGIVLIQLLAGHFNLAWITLLTTALVTLFYHPPLSSGDRVQGNEGRESDGPSRPRIFAVDSRSRGNDVLRVGLAMMLGFLLAAPQLIPAWELKTRSQRSNENFREEIEEGLIPFPYFAQALFPWNYYVDPDGILRAMGAKTNKIEAHVYFGLMPLALAVLGLVTGRTLRSGWPWFLLAIVSAFLASGWPMPFLASWPGFGFFRYCGRYGLGAELAVAVLAGMAFDQGRFRSRTLRTLLGLIVCGITIADLYAVGHRVQYVTIVEPPIIHFRDQSIVFKKLVNTDRVLAVDGNTLALSGAACVPPYLGMGPAEYYQLWNAMPNVFQGETVYDAAIESILKRTGVTHLLVFKPLPSGWPVTLLWQGFDPFLHRRWGRNPAEPIYLYRYDATTHRAYVRHRAIQPLPQEEVVIRELSPHRVVIESTNVEPGEVVLTDINFPGWSVQVDGKAAVPLDETLARTVEVNAGKHTIIWSYTPWSFYAGLLVSISSLLMALFAARLMKSTGYRWIAELLTFLCAIITSWR